MIKELLILLSGALISYIFNRGKLRMETRNLWLDSIEKTNKIYEEAASKLSEEVELLRKEVSELKMENAKLKIIIGELRMKLRI